ncbi:hypothetical protein JZ751_016528 [Albula glossodonta]|uniref:Zinc finger PHD-type domain-containing protein n=1 Tax=Albula glossodonta TaxID=121402 RepID=A0A8T2NNV0_9TELE|nr:hypothetical protein JZ751_016528 [Albula glossodonta]
MEPFVKRFQPDRYQGWKQGKDPCTIDHTRPTPASTPELQSWLNRRKRPRPTTRRRPTSTPPGSSRAGAPIVLPRPASHLPLYTYLPPQVATWAILPSILSTDVLSLPYPRTRSKKLKFEDEPSDTEIPAGGAGITATVAQGSRVRREPGRVGRGAAGRVLEPEPTAEAGSGGRECHRPPQQTQTPPDLAYLSGDNQMAVCGKICTVSVSRIKSDCFVQRVETQGGTPATGQSSVCPKKDKPEREEEQEEEEEEEKEEVGEEKQDPPPGEDHQGETSVVALPLSELMSQAADQPDSQILEGLPAGEEGTPTARDPASPRRESDVESRALSADNHAASCLSSTEALYLGSPKTELMTTALGDRDSLPVDQNDHPLPVAPNAEVCPSSVEPAGASLTMTDDHSTLLCCSPALLSLPSLGSGPGPGSEMPSLTPELPDEGHCPPLAPALEMPSLTPAVAEDSKAPLCPKAKSLEDPPAPVVCGETVSRAGEVDGVQGQGLLQSHYAEGLVGLSAQPAVLVHMAMPVFLTQEEEKDEMAEPRELQTLTTVLCDVNTDPLTCSLDPHCPITRPTPLQDRTRPLAATPIDSAIAPAENNGFLLSEDLAGNGERSPLWSPSKDGPFGPGIWESLDARGPAVVIENAHPEFPVLLTEGKDGRYGLSSPSHAGWNREVYPETLPHDPGTRARPGQSALETQTEALSSDFNGIEMEEALDSPAPHKELTTLRLAAQEREVPGCRRDKCSPSGEGDSDADLSTTRGGDTSSESTEGNNLSDLDCGDTELEPGEICTNPSQVVIKMGKKRTTKSWRHPLRKPTARAVPSAVKQQAASDEELPDVSVADEEAQEVEPWAKHLLHLWHNRKPSFFAEREYNAAAARMEPHCAICTLFMPSEESRVVVNAVSGSSNAMTGLCTKPLIPEICFVYREEPCPPRALPEEEGSSPLISCSRCLVQVHASCYGIHAHDVSGDWSCDRCTNGDMAAECCLCNLRGGALKQTTDNKWAHIMCAVALPEVRFSNEAERGPIDISRVPPQRYKLVSHIVPTPGPHGPLAPTWTLGGELPPPSLRKKAN